MYCSDGIADFDHPRSGIESIVDKMAFPSCGNPPELDMQRYLTELSIRCLLNRVHHSLYFTNNVSENQGRSPSERHQAVSIQQPLSSSLGRVCTELERQLKDWYAALPDGLRPDLTQTRGVPGDLHACLLRLRYWSARFIIYQPFMIYAISISAEVGISEIVLEKCEACVSSCRSFLYAALDLLSAISPYTYAVTQW